MSDNPFTLLGKEIPKGKKTILELEIAKLHTGNSIKIPVIIERARKEGPTLLLMAGVHGDEINGVAIIRDLILWKLNKPKKGMIICIPVFNVFGYLNLSREFPDGRDLNRVFPGSANGSLASQFANKFTKEIAPHVDYVIDYHTGGADRDNYPNIRCSLDDAEDFELAKVFNPPFIVHSKPIPKSVRETFKKMGTPILLYEGGKSNSLDEHVIECGISGTLNIMKHLDMIEDEPEITNKGILIRKSKWIRAPRSGMFRSIIERGQRVSKNDLLGTISDPYGAFSKKIYAGFDCHIFGLNTSPIVHKGDALFHVSFE